MGIYNMEHNHKMMSAKISKIMHEGVRGKKVSQKQAVAIAFNMARKGKLGRKAKKLASKKRKKHG